MLSSPVVRLPGSSYLGPPICSATDGVGKIVKRGRLKGEPLRANLLPTRPVAILARRCQKSPRRRAQLIGGGPAGSRGRGAALAAVGGIWPEGLRLRGGGLRVQRCRKVSPRCLWRLGWCAFGAAISRTRAAARLYELRFRYADRYDHAHAAGDRRLRVLVNGMAASHALLFRPTGNVQADARASRDRTVSSVRFGCALVTSIGGRTGGRLGASGESLKMGDFTGAKAIINDRMPSGALAAGLRLRNRARISRNRLNLGKFGD